MTGKRAYVIAGGAVLLALGVAGAVAARSCSRSAPASVASGSSIVHPTGLVLDPQPGAYRVRETAAGFRVEPADAHRLRSPWSVDLRIGDVNPPAGSDLQRKKVGEQDARYLLKADEESGSGGALHTLTAWIACGSSGIVMIATQQAEQPATPDWSAAWAILAASRCEPRR